MAEQSILDVLRLQRFAEKRIRAKRDHSHRQIVTGAPVRIRFSQFIGRKRRWKLSCASHECSPGIQVQALRCDALYSLNSSDNIQMNFRVNPISGIIISVLTGYLRLSTYAITPSNHPVEDRWASSGSSSGWIGRNETSGPSFMVNCETNPADRSDSLFASLSAVDCVRSIRFSWIRLIRTLPPKAEDQPAISE